MGTFIAKTKGGQYQKGDYMLNGATYSNIHVFTSLGKTKQAILPMVYAQQTALAAMNPNASIVSANDVIAKINGNVYVYNHGPVGINYEGSTGKFYVGAVQYQVSQLQNAFFYTNPKYSPTFCIKADGTATIRWFSSQQELQYAVDACSAMIASAHALVFQGKNVLAETVMDAETNSSHRVIYDSSNGNGCRHDFGVVASSGTAKSYRTLLGHKAGSEGVYIAVCTDSSISLSVAAQLMLDLGCDYAVNLDGGPSVQMRIKSGYAPTGISGKVTSVSGSSVYAGVCFCEK